MKEVSPDIIHQLTIDEQVEDKFGFASDDHFMESEKNSRGWVGADSSVVGSYLGSDMAFCRWEKCLQAVRRFSRGTAVSSGVCVFV